MLYLSARQLSRGPRQRLSAEGRWPRMASGTGFRLLTVGLAAVTFLTLRDRIPLPLVDPLFRDAIVWLALVSAGGYSF